MATMTFGEFQRTVSVDNRNIDNVIREYINESANASVISTFDDSLILLDTVNEDIYIASYTFNPEKLSVIIEGYEKVELEEDSDLDMKIAIKSFLLDENADSDDVLREFYNVSNSSRREVNNIIMESKMEKASLTHADFDELSYINEEFADELQSEDFFEDYKERLLSHPLPNVLTFNWQSPVAFTVQESTEPVEILSSNCKNKALQYVNSKEFKEEAKNICKAIVEDVDDGNDLLFEMFENNTNLFSLSNLELKEAFYKAMILSPELQSVHKELFEAVKFILNSDENIALLKETINIDAPVEDEDEDEEKSEKKDKEKTETEDETEDDKEDEKATELTTSQKETLIKYLDKVAEKATDEKLADMAKELKDKLEDSGDSTKPDDVKEAVRFLSV